MADFHRLMAPMAQGGACDEKDKDPQKAPKRNNIGIACAACKKRKLKVHTTDLPSLRYHQKMNEC